MTRPTVAAVCMPDRGHFQRMRAVVAGLAARGARVVVHTDAGLRAQVEAAGAEFRDLFADRTVEQADSESWPPVVRYVSFAGTFAERLRDEIGASAPNMVLHDTFAVAGPVVARLLDVPYVNVCAGHAVVPERFVRILQEHPRVSISLACRRSVERLHAQFGFTDMSPFSYTTGMSPYLNLYCEPPQFLPAADRDVFEPVVFFGSLAEDAPHVADREARRRRWFGSRQSGDLAVYASFGTAIWMSRTMEALAALTALAEWAAGTDRVHLLISLGGAPVSAADRALLERPHVTVADFVDQWDVLGCADVFVTHHGLNSTHEAIAFEVPMISYPFVWDQPGLAAECQRLGLAVPLSKTVMAPVSGEDVEAALKIVRSRRSRMAGALRLAHRWEREIIAARPATLERVLELAR